MSDHTPPVHRSIGEGGRFSAGRHAGVLVPLFSIPTRRSWGVGEIPDLLALGQWLNHAGLDFVQLLPMNEMQEGQSSPYSALSAMAIDPIFIALNDVHDWIVAGRSLMSDADHAAIDASRHTPRVDYASVRRIKNDALRKSFSWFAKHLDQKGAKDRDRRVRAFHAFEEREAWWLDDYVLFRALHDAFGGRHWREWEDGVRDRDPSALASARERLAPEIRYYGYLQWLADEQWRRVRAEAPVGLFGDFPFMVSGHSADVWSRQHEFDLDASVGTPPDAFSVTGQDWHLPAYRWNVVEASGDAWLRDRARRSAELFDGFRIDHLIGFFRTYVRKPGYEPGFQPAGEHAQRAMGERLLSMFAESGATVIAEDLGTVPDFLRESLAARRLPGMKVMRWEREWHDPGQPFRDPASYPAVSVATSGTHDTETLAEWWDGADEAERRALLALPEFAPANIPADAPFSDRVRDAMLEALFASGSNILILPIQDIFGWRDRVNVPALVDDRNWTWRLPAPIEDLAASPASHERASFLQSLAQKYGRV
ncbi:MAG TPA: 4-alpha-glucanotransferase [Vicinamibacterales bacterium]|jgi:4-alpha-glucanotransferase